MFLTDLERLLLPQLWPGAVVFMDHLRAHKLVALRQKIVAAGMRPLYLSPCSADFNPIESFWSKLKGHLRKVAARTTAAFDRATVEGLRQISPADARGYFAHRGNAYA